MRVDGIMLALMTVPAAYTQEYNRWYDLDHMPEHVSKADVLMGRRYVAPRALRAAPGIEATELTSGHPPYATIYSYGGPLDFMSAEALGLWAEKDRGILRAGRRWRIGAAQYARRWRLASSRTRPSIHVSADAVPYLAHLGMIVALGRVGSGDQRARAAEWWDRTHLPDLFAVPGIAAAMRFDPVEPGEDEMMLHVLLCDEPVEQVMSRVDASRVTQRALGRYPAHGGVYESLAFLPYDTIVPLSYDFDLGPIDDQP